MDLKEIGSVDPHTHWYYQSKSELLIREVVRIVSSIDQVVDVGAGSGYFSVKFAEVLNPRQVVLVDPGYGESMPPVNSSNFELLHTSSHKLVNFQGRSLVLLLDVLEHVGDDKLLMEEIFASAPVGTVFVVSVPAHSWLWSGHDEFLDHKRRYTLKQLVCLLDGLDARVHERGYIFQLLLPAVFLIRRCSTIRSDRTTNLRKSSRLVNDLLRFVCSSKLGSLGRIPGLTAVLIFSKCDGNVSNPS